MCIDNRGKKEFNKQVNYKYIHIVYRIFLSQPLRNVSMERNIKVMLAKFNMDRINVNIQGVSRLVDITVGGDFLGLCDQKISYEYVSDFGRLRSYGHF
jgi:hypothetical protein